MPLRSQLVVATFLLSMLLYVDRVCISAAKKPIAGDLRFDDERTGWVFAAFSLGYALLQSPSGWAADRFGLPLISWMIGLIGWQMTFVSLGVLAVGLVERGVRKLIVAGGETSGAVVARLGVTTLRVGPAVCPGVPWTESLAGPHLALALKSGNLGGDAFFTTALGVLP